MDLTEARGPASRRHPWEVARAKFFQRLLRDAGLLDEPRAILDVGAGDGYLARSLLAALPAGSHVVCYDAHYTDEDLRAYAGAPTPGLSFIKQKPDERFGVLLLLDVLEHVPDHRTFLRELVADALAPGGTLVISVPAWQYLFSKHDEAMNHYRRYSPRTLLSMLAEVGLTVRNSGGAFHSLLVSRALTVAKERARRLMGREPSRPPNAGEWRAGAAMSSLAEHVLAIDNAFTLTLSRFGQTAPGLTVWAVASRDRDST